MDYVTAISAGGNHSMAIKTDGSLWTWGSNAYAQIGDGSYRNSTTPKKVLDNIKSIVAGGNHSLAVKNDGNLLAWGYNTFGQIGDGTHTNKTIPTTIISAKPSEEKDIEETTLVDAKPNNSTILIDGRKENFESYNIGGYNYFKLRDIAMALNGTEKSFQVKWDDGIKAIKIIPNSTYTEVGGELLISDNPITKKALLSTNSVYVNQQKIELEIYNIDGNNYFKLRDIARIIDFNVIWDQENQTISIDTFNEFIPE